MQATQHDRSDGPTERMMMMVAEYPSRLLVKKDLFSAAAVSARGAMGRRLVQWGCEWSSIVTWVTGQRTSVSEPDTDALVVQ